MALTRAHTSTKAADIVIDLGGEMRFSASHSSYYAALLPRRGPHIASHSVCLSVCPSVPLSNVTSRHLANYNDTHVFFYFTVEPSYERTFKIEKLRFSLMGQRHVCTFRHAQRAAYRTAMSAAQILVLKAMNTT